MSRMGSWVLELQEASLWMTREEFAEQYGASQLRVWDEVNNYYPDLDGDYAEDGSNEEA